MWSAVEALDGTLEGEDGGMRKTLNNHWFFNVFGPRGALGEPPGGVVESVVGAGMALQGLPGALWDRRG